MLSRIRRWLGWESAEDLDLRPQHSRPRRPSSATAHLFAKSARKPPKPKPKTVAAADGDFNPYNTGKFDRSASWERISKTQR